MCRTVNRGATTQYEYDALGRVTWVKPALGYWVETQYDTTNARWVLTRRGDGQGASVDATTLLDSFGRVVETTNSVGVRTRTAHDALGRTSYQSLPYTTADVGRIFRYDVLGRLREVETGDSKKVTYAYQYDPLGNRTSKAAPAVTYTYDSATKRLTTVTGNAQVPEVGAYTYDGAGNLTSDPSGTYTYTPFNLLETATVGGTTATYRYDGNHERKLRIMSEGTVFFYHGLGSALLSEYTRRTGEAEGRWERDHIYLGGRVVASVSRR